MDLKNTPNLVFSLTFIRFFDKTLISPEVGIIALQEVFFGYWILGLHYWQ